LKALYSYTIIIIFCLIYQNSFSQYKVIGFYPNWYNESTKDDIQWQHLTDLAYCFGEPVSSGELKLLNQERLISLADSAQAHQVKLHLSIGGASQGSKGWTEITSDPSLSRRFIQNILTFVQKYELDGINLDWEYPDTAQAKQYDRTFCCRGRIGRQKRRDS
jgi:GH18 family chitinase